MKNILVPTDFSEISENAIVYAINLFKNEECKFYLLNTFMPSAQYDEVYPWHDDLEDSNPQKSMKGLASLSDRLTKKHKSRKHIFVTHSAMNTMIGEMKKTIKKENIDLVVMGTHGATGIKNKIFGSNTTQAISKIKVPLIAVPSDFTFRTPKKILFPTDLEISFSNKQLKALLYISNCHKSCINLLHVSAESELSGDKRNNKLMLERVLEGIEHNTDLIEGDNFRSTINEFQQARGVDFLVMIKNKHTFMERLFLKSEIKHIGLHIKVPFLVIPCLSEK